MKEEGRKKGEKKAEYGAQYWNSIILSSQECHKGKMSIKMAWNNAIEWGSVIHLHHSKNASERTTYAKIE